MSPEADRTIWIGDDAPSIADALRGRGFQITTDPDAARIHLGDGGLALLDGESHDSLEQRIYRAFPASKLVPLSGGARLDAAAGTVALGTTSARLTATERRVLLFLAGCGAGGASAEELLHAVWGYRPGVKSRTVISTVHRIRAKLDGLGLAGLLQSMTAPAGYRLAEAAPADLLGRDRELAALERALQEPGAIALIGPGGVGKTHLASAALRRWRDGPTAAVSGARWIWRPRSAAPGGSR